MTNTAKITDRFLAYLIDVLPFLAGYHATLYSLAQRGSYLSFTTDDWRKVLACWVALYVSYHAVLNCFGGSVGKRMLGLRVVGRDGGSLNVARAFLRAIGLLISTPLFNLGFLWAFVQPESRTWHDLLAGSWVVEDRPKAAVESLANALLSFMALAGILTFSWWVASIRPTAGDLEAVRKAREGLKVLARIEEKYKAQHGAYTDQLAELARTSGDFDQFRSAMRELFDAERFQILAGRERFILRARAKDRRKTPVSVSGP